MLEFELLRFTKIPAILRRDALKISKKTKMKLIKLLELESLQVLMGGIVVALLIISRRDFLEVFDVRIVSSIMVLFVLKVFSTVLSKYLRRKIEDDLKFDIDDQLIVNKYPLTKGFVEATFADKNNSNQLYRFPVVAEPIQRAIKISIVDDKDKYYEMPSISKENYHYLMNAHACTVVYNQVNIRLDHYERSSHELKLFTSRTTYFDSLVTNRCMDYSINQYQTVRGLTNPGPWLHSLKESCLSNHIGFNVYLETVDGFIVFIRRNEKVSIGKNKVGTSVSASLKTKHALNEGLGFDEIGFRNAVINEIKDELSLDEKIDEKEFSIQNNMIAIYRDVLEGGKPQFLFYYKSKLTKEQVAHGFYDRRDSQKKSKNLYIQMNYDGDELIFIHKNELEASLAAPDKLKYENRKLEILPSTAATLVIFNDYRKSGNKNT